LDNLTAVLIPCIAGFLPFKDVHALGLVCKSMKGSVLLVDQYKRRIARYGFNHDHHKVDCCPVCVFDRFCGIYDQGIESELWAKRRGSGINGDFLRLACGDYTPLTRRAAERPMVVALVAKLGRIRTQIGWGLAEGNLNRVDSILDVEDEMPYLVIPCLFTKDEWTGIGQLWRMRRLDEIRELYERKCKAARRKRRNNTERKRTKVSTMAGWSARYRDGRAPDVLVWPPPAGRHTLTACLAQ